MIHTDSDTRTDPGSGLPSAQIRLGSMAIGMGLCLLISVGLPYGEFVIQGTRLGLSSSTPAAFFLLFLIIAFLQPLLGLLRRSWLLNRAELLLVTVMMMLATAIPSRGLTGPLIPAISSLLYYAAPENNWTESLVPYVPGWMIVDDEQAVKYFYEGLARGQSIPWTAWGQPLAWWLLLLASFYLVVLCIMVIMRRQWMDNERLLYPLTQVPLSMIDDGRSMSGGKPLLRNPIMWTGFAVPFVFNSINALHRYYEFVPELEVSLAISLVQNNVVIPIRLNYLMLGLAYFINTGVSFSMWFFYLLAKVQEACLAYLGILSTEQIDAYSHAGPTTGMLSHQSMGAMIVLLLLGLWTARTHLREVWDAAWKGSAGVDRIELLSCRFALLGLGVGLAVMVAWLWCSGLSMWAVSLYLFGAFVIFIALTRVIVEAGLSSAVEGMSGAGFLVSGVGSTVLGPTGTMAAGFTMAWAGDMLVFMMAPCANGIRMLHGVGLSRRKVLTMMGAAVTIAIAGSIWATLEMGYRYGALNLHRQYFSGLFALEPFRFADRFITSPTGPYWPGWWWTGFGAAIVAVLTTARHYLLWWPLHPIGYVVSGTWILNSIWFNIFLAWIVKATVLKYTGPSGYRSTRALFLGVILGQFVVGGAWLITDAFTGMRGNSIRMY